MLSSLTALVRHSRSPAAWATALMFLTFGSSWVSDLDGLVVPVVLFAWILGVIFWSAFGVITEAEHLAELLGEPVGTLIFTFTIVALEVALIAAVMLGPDPAPTIGRDTMFAVMMIVLNGVVGLSLLVGGWRHHEQSYSLPGATAYLGVIIPLATIALVLPSLTTSTDDDTLTTTQAIAFSILSAALYAVFLAIQTGRHRSFFADPEPGNPLATPEPLPEIESARRAVARHALLLAITALPIVLLSKPLGKIVDHGIAALDAPEALSGVMIALIVFTPEGVSALRAAHRNELQRTVNLCLGAFLSTVGLTLPAVLTVGLVTGETVVLGLDSSGIALVGLTLVMSLLTFSGPRTTILEGAVHLLVFFVYIVLVFSP
jgi:Ca2+:H+ antiporter